MKAYTVIGVWDHSDEVVREDVMAKSPHDAMQCIAARNSFDSDLKLIGAIPGHGAYGWVCPLQDMGRTLQASDYEE